MPLTFEEFKKEREKERKQQGIPNSTPASTPKSSSPATSGPMTFEEFKRERSGVQTKENARAYEPKFSANKSPVSTGASVATAEDNRSRNNNDPKWQIKEQYDAAVEDEKEARNNFLTQLTNFGPISGTYSDNLKAAYNDWQNQRQEANDLEEDYKKAFEDYRKAQKDYNIEKIKAVTGSALLGHIPQTIAFAKHFSDTYDYLNGRSDTAPKSIFEDYFITQEGREAAKRYAAQGGDPTSQILGSGYLEMIAPVSDALGYVGQVAGIKDAEKLREFADKAQNLEARWVEDQKTSRGKAGQFGVDVGVQAVPLLADTALTYASGGGSAAAKAALATRAFGGGTMEARKGGGSLVQQGLYGAGSAAVELITEKMFDAFGGKVYGASAMDDVINHWAGKTFKSPAARAAAKYVVEAAGEGIEEVTSDVINPILKSIYNDKSVTENYKDMFADFDSVVYDFAIGAALGAVGGSTNVVSQMAGNISAQEAFFMDAGREGKTFAQAAAEWEALEASGKVNAENVVSSGKDSSKAAGEQKAPNRPTTPPATQSAVKQEAQKFNTEAEPAAEAESELEAKPKGRQVGKKTGRQIAWDAWFGDNVRQDAEPEGVSVDASDFNDEASTGPEKSDTIEPKAKPKTGADILADIRSGKAKTTDKSFRNLEQRAKTAIQNALAQNGIDYNNDPRSEYYDESVGDYREVDLDSLDEEAKAKYQEDMRQIRLLDAVDGWLDKYGQKYFSANKGSEAEIQQGLQNALNNYVRRYLDSRTDKSANSEAIEEIMAKRREESKLKELSSEKKQKPSKLINATQIGENLYRVSDSSGRTTTEAADSEAEAIQKFKDSRSEASKKAADQRKAKEAELGKMRKEVIESGENPAQVEGSDGNTYEVTKQFSNEQQTRYEYVVTELDEDGLPSDREARVFQNRASTNEEAVQYAIDNDLFREDDYSDLTEGSSDEGRVDSNGSFAERGNDDRSTKRGQNSEGTSEYSEFGQSEEKNAIGRAFKSGEKVSLAELCNRDYELGKDLTYIGAEDYSPVMQKNAERVRELCGKDVRYVRGPWPDFIGQDSVATTNNATGEIVFNLDAFEAYVAHGGKHAAVKILEHEAFHSLSVQHPDILGKSTQALINAYGEDAVLEFAKTYAGRLLGSEDAAAFYRDNGDYPGFVYGEICADAFSEAYRYGVDLSKAHDAVVRIVSAKQNKEPSQPRRSSKPEGADEVLEKMSQDREAESEDAEFARLRKVGKEQTNAKEYAYQKKLESEQNSEEAKEQAQSDEEKAKSTFGKDYDKVQKSADDFDGIKTRFDEESFQTSDKGRDRSTRGKLKKLREAFRKAATTGDVETLFSIYEDLKNDSNLANFYNEEIQEDIDNWRKLSDPNLDSYNEGAAPYAAARTMQRMAHKFKLANEYQQTLSKMNETLRGSKNGVLRKIGKSERLTAAVARALMRWQVNPDTVFKMIDAFDKGNAGEGYKLAKELQTAHREKYRVLREARATFDKASALKGFQDFAFGKQTVKDYSGREWDMRSALSVVKAIDTIRSTSGKKLGGTDGFGVMDNKGNIEFISMKDVDAVKLYESLKSGLSDVAIKYGDLATEAFNAVKEPLRAKYKQNNGVDIGMIGDEDTRLGDKKGIEKAVYSPLSYVDKSGNVYQFDIAKQETYNNIPRFLRERSDAGGTYILIKPYTEVTGKYFEQVSNYLAYSTFNEKMKGLGKSSSYESGLGNTLAEVFGKDMGNWYKSYVEDLGTYQNEDDVEGVNSLLRKGRHQLQQGALLFSVSVPMKQISSYWAASGILHPDSLIKNYRIKLLKPKNSSDAATMLASRAMDNLEQSAAEAAKDAEKWLGKLKYSSKFVKLAADAINQMDYNTVSNLLSATEYDVLKYQFNGDKSVIGTDEYKAAVEEKFQDVVDRSQPNFDKQMRAEYGRTDNEIVRMLSMFRTQQTQNLNLLATAIGEFMASKGTKNEAQAMETLKQTIAGQAASALSLSMLTILADMLLHRQKKYEDKDKELDITKVLQRLGINAIEASAGTMWFGDSIAKWAIDRISGGKTKEFYGVNMGVISTVSDILENFENFIKNPSRSNARYCAGNIATLMGIPLNNAYSMLNSVIMYGKDLLGSNDGDYDDILKYLDAQAKAKRKEEEKAAKNSMADVLAEAAKQNSSQNELNSAQAKNESPVSGWKTKQYDALIGAGMSSERSVKVLTAMDTDHNDSIKQSEMLAYYKAHPEDEKYIIAMWNSYGYKTTWEAAKAKAK